MAFYKAVNLRSVNFPEGLKRINEVAFDGCESLTLLEFPESLEFIGGWAFGNCPNVRSIRFPQNAVYELIARGVGEFPPPAWVCAARGSVYNGSFHFPTAEGDDVWYAEALTIFGTTQWYKNQPQGCVYAGNVLIGYKGDETTGSTVRIREGTTIISENVFNNCNWITDVVLPDSVRYVGAFAFDGTPFENKLRVTEVAEFTLPDGTHAYTPGSLTLPDGRSLICESYISQIPYGLAAYVDFDALPGAAEGKLTERNGAVYAPAGLPVTAVLKLEDVFGVLSADDVPLTSGVLGTGCFLLKPDGGKIPVVVIGDADGDGNVTAADARLALRQAVGLENAEKGSPVFLAEDPDADNAITSDDARRILRATVGLETLA